MTDAVVSREESKENQVNQSLKISSTASQESQPQAATKIRRIDLGGQVDQRNQGRAFSSNNVSTTRYKLWSIIPLNLFEQFRRFANLWFLGVSTVQMLPYELSPTTKWATLAPLCGILFATFLKDAYEDFKRWQDDCRVNNQQARQVTFNSNGEDVVNLKWSDIVVGMYILLRTDDPVPADMILLATDAPSGTAFVDTAQLDGESSLKHKEAPEETNHINLTVGLKDIEGHLDAELPNEQVQTFQGVMHLKGRPRGIPLDMKNMLLRGSTVRDTAWVVGVVVYTGVDTKVMKNSNRSQTAKRSHVEVTSNMLLMIVFALLAAISGIFTAVKLAFYGPGTKGAINMSWVWPTSTDISDNKFLAAVTFLIGYNNLIPISLYMTVDLVRALQAFLMEKDKSMVYESKGNRVTCKVRNSCLCEDLGHIEFVFTDKTGTLTENEMCFKAGYVGGQTFGYWDDTLISDDSDDQKGPTDTLVRIPPASICIPLHPTLWRVPTLPEQFPNWSSLGGLAVEESDFHRFFLCLAICHTAVPHKLPDAPSKQDISVNVAGALSPSSEQPPQEHQDPFMQHLPQKEAQERQQLLDEASQTQFRSPSPDEEALLAMCRDYGFFLKKRAGNQITVNIRGKDVHYMILLCNDFTSDRKRMSVLVQQISEEMTTPQGLTSPMTHIGIQSMGELPKCFQSFTLFAKGADSVMMERLWTGGPGEPPDPCGSDALSSSRKLGTLSESEGGESEEEEEGEAGEAGEAGVKSKGSAGSIGSTGSRRNKQQVGQASSSSDQDGCSSANSGGHAAGCSSGDATCPDDSEVDKHQRAKKQLRNFAVHGMRTLVCAQREMSEQKAEMYIRKMLEARGSFVNRDKMMNKIMDDMENELSLLGITAVEDKIQPGVPETVDMLFESGIHVWMLTGDNMDTAQNIARLCHLTTSNAKQFILGADITSDDMLHVLQTMYLDISNCVQSKASTDSSFDYSLVVHGQALYTILDAGESLLKNLFIMIACASKSVIACRLAPAQKAALVQLVNKSLSGQPVTMAIGDGGNDVNMIQKAHVGVGIFGAEGCEAVNVSDFAIGQFRFLRQLMFVHGRANARRIGVVIGYSFYKNFLMVITLVCYAPFTGFSGTTFYDSYLIMMYNTFFTSIPILLLGTLDAETYAPAALTVPKLYRLGANRTYFNRWVFVRWLFRGTLHAVLNFCVARFIVGGTLDNTSIGYLDDRLSLGTWSYVACCLMANATVLLDAQVLTGYHILAACGSVAVIIPAVMIYSSHFGSTLLRRTFMGVGVKVFGSGTVWLALMLILALSVLIELAVDALRRTFFPDLVAKIQEFQRKKQRADVKKELARSSREFSNVLPTSYGSQQPFPSDAYLSICDGLSDEQLRLRSEIPSSFPYGWERHACDDGDFKAEARELTAYISGMKPPEKRKLRFQNLHGGSLQPLSADSGQGCCRCMGSQTGDELQMFPVGRRRYGCGLSSVQGFFRYLYQLQWVEMSWLAELDYDVDVLQRSDRSNESALQLERSHDRFYSWITLEFRSNHQESAFCQNSQEDCKRQLVLMATVVVVVTVLRMLAKVVAIALKGEMLTTNWLGTWLMLGACGAIVLFGVLPLLIDSKYVWKRESHVAVLCFVTVISHFASRACGLFRDEQGFFQSVGIPFFLVSGARIRMHFIYFALLLHLLLEVTLVFVDFGESQGHGDGQLFHVVSAVFAALLHAYSSELFRRKMFLWHSCLWLTREDDMKFLKGMYPEDVIPQVLQTFHNSEAERMAIPSAPLSHESFQTIFQERGRTTVLFINIHDFSVLVNKVQPTELVATLDRIFDMMGRTCQEHGVTKIETVGKTFMAAGLPTLHKKGARRQKSSSLEDALSCVRAAASIRKQITTCVTGMNDVNRLSLKIGLHTGDVVSGVVGSRKPQFALFGDTVNTAARVTAKGEPNRVNISESTYSEVWNDQRFQWKMESVYAKGKGQMNVFHLVNSPSTVDLKGKQRVSLSAEPQQQQPQQQEDASLLEAEKAGTGSNSVQSVKSAKSSKSAMSSLSEQQAEEEQTPRRNCMMRCLLAVLAWCKEVHKQDVERQNQLRPLLSFMSLFWLWFLVSSLIAREGMSDISFRLHIGYVSTLFTVLVLAGAYYRYYARWYDQGEEVAGEAQENPYANQSLQSIGNAESTLEANSLAALVTGVSRAGDLDAEKSVLSQKSTWSKHSEPRAKQEVKEEKKPARLAVLERRYFTGAVVLLLAGFGVSMTDDFQDSEVFALDRQMSHIESLIIIPIMLHLSVLRVNAISLVAAILPVAATAVFGSGLAFDSVAYLIALDLLIIYCAKAHQSNSFKELKMLKTIKEDHEACATWLQSFLPKEVLRRMQDDTLRVAYTYTDMSLLFADIAGFTNYCATHSAFDAVTLVTSLFAAFDECCTMCGAYKVCTIGDAYLATNEPKMTVPDKFAAARSIVALAQVMIKVLELPQFKDRSEGISMRIGLHHGNFVAGVIGSNMVRFDIWGDDVLIGETIEQNSIPGEICCSEALVSVLARNPKLRFEFHCAISQHDGSTVNSYKLLKD